MDYKGNRQSCTEGHNIKTKKSCCYSIYNKPQLLSLYKSHNFPLALEKKVDIKETNIFRFVRTVSTYFLLSTMT